MGWCNDKKNKKYNKLIKVNKNIKHEKMFRKDYKYNYIILLLIIISKNTKIGKGSAIFIHLKPKIIKEQLDALLLKKKI